MKIDGKELGDMLKGKYLRGRTYHHLIDVLVEKCHDPVIAMVEMARDEGLDIKYRYAANLTLFNALVPKQTSLEISQDEETTEAIKSVKKMMKELNKKYESDY